MPFPPRGQHRTPRHSQRDHIGEARRQRRIQRRGQRQDLAARPQTEKKRRRCGAYEWI